MTFRRIATVLVCLLVAGALALLANVFLGNQELGSQALAQAKQDHATPKSKTKGKSTERKSPDTAQAAPNVPVRTETITYDVWTVTCRDTADGKSKKVCSATLPMQMQQQNRVVNLGAWLIVRNNENAMISILQTPQVDVGVLIGKGVELRLGENKPHKMEFYDCSPQRCEATFPMDDGATKQLIAARDGAAVITFWKADGAEFNINLASIKGVDKAIAAVR